MAQGPVPARRLLYVAGANRSGSTLLEVLLAQHPDVLSAGELFNAARALRDPGEPCTCGARLGACPLWGPVAADLQALARTRGMTIKDLAKALRRIEGIGALADHLRGRAPAGDVELYTAVQRLVLDRVWRTRPAARVLVDPSKSERGAAARPLALQSSLGIDVCVVHLVRDPRGIVSSARRGTNKTIVRGEERRRVSGPLALASWLQVNRAVEKIVDCLGPGRALRVRFEDLVTRPADTLGAICAFAGLDPAPALAGLASPELRAPEHMIAGNRLRFAPIRLDARQASPVVPWYYRPLCRAVARLADRARSGVETESCVQPASPPYTTA